MTPQPGRFASLNSKIPSLGCGSCGMLAAMPADFRPVNPSDSPAASSATPRRSGPVRLRSLDVFRGATIGAMLIVNNPGSWSDDIYAPLKHAPWHGCTPTDLIFPFFLFIVGVAMAFSSRLSPVTLTRSAAVGPPRLRVYLSIFHRAAVLVLLGLGLNFTSLLFKDTFDLSSWRIPGVLQRIGLCYGLAAVIMLHFSIRTQALVSAAVLLGYAALLRLVPSPAPAAGAGGADGYSMASNIVAYVDLWVFGKSHLYRATQAVTHDPEGLLSTLPALVTTLIGVWAGTMLKSRIATPAAQIGAVSRLVLAGGLAALAGWGWSLLPGDLGCPINKELWTSSYVLYTGGWAMMGLGGCVLLFDVLSTRWLRAFGWVMEVMGLNAILLFVGSGLMARAMGWIRWSAGTEAATLIDSKRWLYLNVFKTLPDTRPGSLAFALAFVLVWWIVAWYLWRRRWFWKI